MEPEEGPVAAWEGQTVGLKQMRLASELIRPTP